MDTVDTLLGPSTMDTVDTRPDRLQDMDTSFDIAARFDTGRNSSLLQPEPLWNTPFAMQILVNILPQARQPSSDRPSLVADTLLQGQPDNIPSLLLTLAEHKLSLRRALQEHNSIAGIGKWVVVRQVVQERRHIAWRVVGVVRRTVVVQEHR